MARLVYDENLQKVVDKAPGRSMYLSNKQWAALCNFLEQLDIETFKKDESGALSKLLKISQEVTSK